MMAREPLEFVILNHAVIVIRSKLLTGLGKLTVESEKEVADCGRWKRSNAGCVPEIVPRSP